MNSRERLQRITKEANDSGCVTSCSDNDAAALRKLDLLLLDAYKLVSMDKHDAQFREGWIQRAAQAGYGEK